MDLIEIIMLPHDVDVAEMRFPEVMDLMRLGAWEVHSELLSIVPTHLSSMDLDLFGNSFNGDHRGAGCGRGSAMAAHHAPTATT